jgi:hypothetical protein
VNRVQPLSRARARSTAMAGGAARRGAAARGGGEGDRGREERPEPSRTGRGGGVWCGVGDSAQSDPHRTAPARARLSLVGVGTSGRVGVDPFLLLRLQLGRYI